MGNFLSRSSESSSSQISSLQDKGLNYAAASNKNPTRGNPIPIPQNSGLNNSRKSDFHHAEPTRKRKEPPTDCSIVGKKRATAANIETPAVSGPSKSLPIYIRSRSQTPTPIDDSKKEFSDYENALSEPSEQTPVEPTKLADDPIDHIPVKLIGDDQHILIYPFEPKKPAVPKKRAVSKVVLHQKELNILEGCDFLNDSLIDIFPKIWADQYSNESIHTFTSFFYTKLIGDSSSINYGLIKRWTTRINIFEKKLIIIPVTQSLHWYLVAVTNPGLAIKNRKEYGLELAISNDDQDEMKEEDIDVDELASKPPSPPGREAKLDREKSYIMILNSLGKTDRSKTCENVAEYLKKEATSKLNVRKEDFIKPEFIYTHSPNQSNGYDCGVFCLHYMNSLYKNTEDMMDVLYNNLEYDTGWDIEITLPNFRLTLRRILKKNMLEYRKYLKIEDD